MGDNMISLDYLLKILIVLFVVSLFGYFISVIKEKMDLNNNRISINSKNVTDKLLNELDLKFFKLGNIRLTIGDEIKIYLKNDNIIKGRVLGAKKKENSLCILTLEDRVMELKINNIKKLKIISRYGKII